MFTSGSGSHLCGWQLWWEERAVAECGAPVPAGMKGQASKSYLVGEPQGSCRLPGTHGIPAWGTMGTCL